MAVYGDLARTQGVLRVLIAQLTARFPVGMTSIIMVLHIEHHYGNYTSAGLVLAALSFGQALSGPVTPRWMGRWGMRPVLAVMSVICAAALALIALWLPELWLTLLIAFICGAATPPIGPAVRTIYPKLVPGRLVSGLYSLDASAQEIIWVFGPVVAVFTSAAFSTQVGLMVAVGFMVIGGLWFILNPEAGEVKIPKARRRLGAVLKRPTVILSTGISFVFVASFAALETGIIAVYGEGSFESGMVLAIFAAGSLVGGFIFGHQALTNNRLLVRILIVLIGTLLCLVSTETWWLCVVLFFGGLGTAPTFAALNSLISSTVKFSETAEAFGWAVTGQLMGAAMGSAIAGIMIDQTGAQGAMIVSGIFLTISIVVALAGWKAIPDLRNRDATPLPDTDIITVPKAIS